MKSVSLLQLNVIWGDMGANEMGDHDYGSPDERATVRAALVALRAFNTHIRECNRLGVRCDLQPDERGYVATFTRTVTILPEQDRPAHAGEGAER